MAGLACDIVTPDAKLFSGDATMVVVPGVEGEMGFLKGHEPLVSALADGVVRVQSADGSGMLRFALQGGYVQVSGQKVIILADRALPVENIDVAKVKEAMAELEAAYPTMADDDPAKIMYAADMAWYHVQVKAVEAA